MQYTKNKVDQRSKTRRAEHARQADVVFTPAKVVDNCLPMVPVIDNDLWLDPFEGEGAFVRSYPKEVRVESGDIITGKDFFDREALSADWIVSNPPFSIFDKVLAHTCEVARKGFAYLITFKKLTVNRLKRCRERGFNVTKLALFQIKAAGWQNFLQAFVVFERQASVWLVPPFKIALTVATHTKDRDTRGQVMFPSALVAANIPFASIFKTDQVEEIKKVEHSLLDSSSSSGTCALINSATIGMPDITAHFRRCAKQNKATIALIIDSNRLSVSLFNLAVSLGYSITATAIFEALDTGGYLWHLLVFGLNSSPLLPFEPTTFS